MENKRKSISLLGWIIGALLLIYLGVFCYLNLCRYTQHVDSDIAAEALLAREIWVEKDITPNDWISSTERRIIGIILRDHRQYADGGWNCLCAAWRDFAGNLLFFSEKIVFEQAGIFHCPASTVRVAG